MNIKQSLTALSSRPPTFSALGRTTKRALTLAVLIGGMLALPQVSLANAPIHEAGCVDWSEGWGCTSWSDCVVYTSLHVWHCTYSSYGFITGQASGSY